jgi:hypothetical protein
MLFGAGFDFLCLAGAHEVLGVGTRSGREYETDPDGTGRRRERFELNCVVGIYGVSDSDAYQYGALAAFGAVKQLQSAAQSLVVVTRPYRPQRRDRRHSTAGRS